ncbi:MAG: acyl-CoA dehydrogenase family protein [Bradymonadaceae bacterium]
MSPQQPRGCAFLIREVGEEKIFTPEQFTEDQRMFAQTADDFMNKEVVPLIEELEHGAFDKMVGLLHKAAEIGLLMIDIPEEYGGLGVDKTTSMIVTEKLSLYAGFATSFGAHTGIGTMPLLYFGTPVQKEALLPRLATGELLAAYALTEPGSGSDALAAKTRADLTEDGEHYILNGTKMWITNAGFADLHTVFAQVDGDKFSCFLVEADRVGVSVGAEEKKLGLKGSSTRQLNLDKVKIPVTNLLGEVGKGHKIAFNILNIGRFKLGVGVLGGAKHTLGVAVKYAKERVQFGQPISDFGAIRGKIADMAVKLYTLESMCYRVAGYMDQNLSTLDSGAPDYPEQAMAAIEEFAVEDSIMKVFGSEVLDFVVDEALQIHGGYGYSAEYEIERIYRDSRINRIFEGTNEINRMLIPGMILKRTMKGQLNLFEMIQKVEMALAEPEKPTPPGQDADATLAFERFCTEQAKQLVVYCANQAIQKHMADLREQQEILLLLADMIIEIYAMDSTVSRTLQIIEEKGYDAARLQRAATKVSMTYSFQNIRTFAENLLNHLATGDQLNAHLEAFDQLAFNPRVDIVSLRREIADVVIERERYIF